MATDYEEDREMFEAIIECDQSLDEVIASLADIGVEVPPDQRLIVSKWLDFFDVNTQVPLGHRVSMLRGMLQADRDVRGLSGG